MRITTTLLVISLGGLFSWGHPTRQAEASVLDQARLPLSYRSWTLKSDSSGTKTVISQFVLPVVTSVPLGQSTDLVLSFAGAAASLDPEEGSSSTLNGPADATAQVFIHLADDRLLLHGGFTIPSGKTALDEQEFAVAQALGHPLLGFQLKEYGRGLGISAGTAYAITIAPGIVLGFGGGLIKHGAYTLVAEQEDFQPGMEASVSAGLDAEVAYIQGTSLRLDTAYRIFQADDYGSEKIFEQGNQIEFRATTLTRTSRLHFDTRGRLVLRGNNTYFAGEDATWREIEASAGTLLSLTAVARLPVSRSLWAGLAGEWRHFGGSDTPGVNGHMLGIGPSLETILARHVLLQLRTDILTGSIDDDGNNSGMDLSGFAASLRVSWRSS